MLVDDLDGVRDRHHRDDRGDAAHGLGNARDHLERHRAAGIVEDKSITTDIDNDIDLDDLSFDDED